MTLRRLFLRHDLRHDGDTGGAPEFDGMEDLELLVSHTMMGKCKVHILEVDETSNASFAARTPVDFEPSAVLQMRCTMSATNRASAHECL